MHRVPKPPLIGKQKNQAPIIWNWLTHNCIFCQKRLFIQNGAIHEKSIATYFSS